MEIRNPEVYKISGDRTITVSITFDCNPKATDALKLTLAADALKFYADNRGWKSWARKIVTK